MNELGKIHQLIVPFLGSQLTFNLDAIAMTWIVFGVLISCLNRTYTQQ